MASNLKFLLVHNQKNRKKRENDLCFTYSYLHHWFCKFTATLVFTVRLKLRADITSIALVSRKQKKYLCTSLKAQLNHERIKKCNDELRENKYLVKHSNDYLKQLW